ncbi:glutathionylspermidine synthase, partial [Heyndrickxia sporothermodurans]
TYPLLNKINTKTPLMTTEQYNAIYPIVADYLYHSLNTTEYTHSIEHYEDEDSAGRLLQGFFLIDNKTWEGHYFVFTYEGVWLYNNQPYDMPINIQEFVNKIVCNSHECLIYNKSLTKEQIEMENIERLQMEIAGIDLPHEELLVYMEEEGINGYEKYNASSKANKRAIYASALSILHSIANQPHLMKNYKQDDMTVDSFAKYLQARIDQLEMKVRQMPNDDAKPQNFFNLFQ